MKKYYVIKSLDVSSLKWLYLQRANEAEKEIVFHQDVRWAKFMPSEREALQIINTLPQGENDYYSIEEVYHKF